MEKRYSPEFETREECMDYVARARGFGTRQAMDAYYETLATAHHEKHESSTTEWRCINGRIQHVDPADWDDENDYERRLERATKA